MNSVWVENTDRVSFNVLDGNKRTDVLIIGGGIAGILCAYKLKRTGVDCLLLEADRICSGVTQNTTAKLTLQHGLLYDRLIRELGVERARLYLEAQRSALAEYAKLCAGISCDYTEQPSYVYSMGDRAAIEKEVLALNRLGWKARFSEARALPFAVAGAVRVDGQASFHPLRFLYELAKTLPIYEHTKVLELMPGRARTDRGDVLCKKMIVATHFPILNKHGGYFIKLYQDRSYVLALEGAEKLDGMYVDAEKRGLSFRNTPNRLLLGGGSHRTGKQGGGWRELEIFAKKHYPSAKQVAKWATQDCMTLDGIPYIGQYAKGTPNLYVATGFQKWGMTSAMVAATLLTDLICGKQNDYASLFSPSRSILRPQLALNAFESLIGLLTPTVPRCPHLGCALKYNPQEHSWDCPCHGSRFSDRGELINNPATDDHPRISK